MPLHDPVSGGELVVTELTCPESGVTIKGNFEIPKLARLNPEQYQLLETFLRCRGMISTMEKELNLSYPTIRSRIDGLLQALDLQPVKEIKSKGKSIEDKRKILEQLEQGKITAEEAKARIKEGVEDR